MGLKLLRPLPALVLLLLSIVALAAPPERAPAPGAETTLWLAATSWAEDGDDLLTHEDLARYRTRFAAEPRGVERARGDQLAAPWIAARAWGWAARLGGPQGMRLLSVALLWLAALLGWFGVRARWQAATPVWLVVLLFGSVAFTFLFRLQPELLALDGMLGASLLVWGSGRRQRSDDTYRGDPSRFAVAGRWLLAGALVALPLLVSPAYLPLALPLLIAVPRGERGTGWSAFLVGAAFVFVAAVLASGAPWPMPSGSFTPQLFGWNLFYALVGRSAGIVTGYLPVLLFLAAPAELERRWILPAAGAALLLQLLLYPFDWGGAMPALGNAWFLPVYGALWFAPARSERPLWAVALLLVTAPLLLPRWVQPSGDGTATPAALRPIVDRVRSALPFETTLRSIPGTFEVDRSGVRLRSTTWSIFPGARGLLWQGSRAGELVVESDRPLSSVRLTFGEKGPSAIRIDGGESGNTTFRPSGEVAFDVALGRPARRHPLWWSQAPVAIYFLKLDLPQAPLAPVPFDLELARPAVPTGQKGGS